MDNERMKDNLNESWENMKENTRNAADRASDWVKEKSEDLRDDTDRMKDKDAERTEDRARRKEHQADKLHDKAREKANEPNKW
ncbi:MAG: hypothetical protein LUF87_08075 [Alistipes sp.]|nr:hypothetical protein [Alistipes sp.]